MASALSATEKRVLRAAANGDTNAAIGRSLGLSEDTIKTHFRHIFRKLGAVDRTHAVRLGIEAGEVPITATGVTIGSLMPSTPRDPDYQDTHIAVCFAAEACPCRARYRPVAS